MLDLHQQKSKLAIALTLILLATTQGEPGCHFTMALSGLLHFAQANWESLALLCTSTAAALSLE